MKLLEFFALDSIFHSFSGQEVFRPFRGPSNLPNTLASVLKTNEEIREQSRRGQEAEGVLMSSDISCLAYFEVSGRLNSHTHRKSPSLRRTMQCEAAVLG